jgi:hypothetical protein
LLSVDYVVLTYVVVAQPTAVMAKRKFSPLLHHHHRHQESSAIVTMRAFLKPIRYLIKVLISIPGRIKERNVPRLRKCKERMELAMELEEGLDDGFQATLVM